VDGLRYGRSDRDRIAALLDLHEGRLGVQVLDDDGIAAALRDAGRIALVGASPKRDRPSNGVLRDLIADGFEVVPVNPNMTEVEGLPCYPTVVAAAAAVGPIDIVDVFRRAESCADVARDAVAAGARCLWLQLGIADREAGRIAADAGLSVVMDRCTAIEVRRTRTARRHSTD
jgi:predicted CoA-binding protein